MLEEGPTPAKRRVVIEPRRGPGGGRAPLRDRRGSGGQMSDFHLYPSL